MAKFRTIAATIAVVFAASTTPTFAQEGTIWSEPSGHVSIDISGWRVDPERKDRRLLRLVSTTTPSLSCSLMRRFPSDPKRVYPDQAAVDQTMLLIQGLQIQDGQEDGTLDVSGRYLDDSEAVKKTWFFATMKVGRRAYSTGEMLFGFWDGGTSFDGRHFYCNAPTDAVAAPAEIRAIFASLRVVSRH